MSSPLDSTVISDVTLLTGHPELLIRWRSTAAAGLVHQVYCDGRLVWSGPGTRCEIPRPLGPGSHPITIGATPAAQARQNLLPAVTSDQVTLRWLGGTYQAPTIASFLVYQGLTPGAPPDLTKPVATIAAYRAGLVNDGYGQGGYGQGGYGHAASSYQWTSNHLEPGIWNFGIAILTTEGVAGPVKPYQATIVGPPRPPTTVAATLDPATSRATLTWLASPTAATGSGGPVPVGGGTS